MAVDINQIGKYNKQLILDLKAGRMSSSGYPISDWQHESSYNYDLSYGVMACGNSSKRLQGTLIGKKYYCATSDFEWDMAKRIVHIYDPKNSSTAHKFYRLIHTKGKPGCYLNTYSTCELVTGI